MREALKIIQSLEKEEIIKKSVKCFFFFDLMLRVEKAQPLRLWQSFCLTSFNFRQDEFKITLLNAA